MSRNFTTVSIFALLATAACGGGNPAGPPESTTPTEQVATLDALTETYGCGFGFWIGNPEQTVALRLQYTGEEAPARQVVLPDESWDARMIEGTDLYANWCDDVMEPDEPIPVEERSFPVTAGSLALIGDVPEPFEGGRLTVEASGLQVTLPDGEVVDLGDVTITNESYGFLAG